MLLLPQRSGPKVLQVQDGSHPSRSRPGGGQELGSSHCHRDCQEKALGPSPKPKRTPDRAQEKSHYEGQGAPYAQRKPLLDITNQQHAHPRGQGSLEPEAYEQGMPGPFGAEEQEEANPLQDDQEGGGNVTEMQKDLS